MTVGGDPPKNDAISAVTNFISDFSNGDTKKAQSLTFIFLAVGLGLASVLKGFTFEYVFRLPGFSFTQTFAGIDLLMYSLFAVLQNRAEHSRNPTTVQKIGWTRFFQANLILGGLLAANHGAGTAAIMFINYPTKVILKSCKLLPAMLIGRLMLNKRYSMGESVSVVLLMVGLIGFTTSDMTLELGHSVAFGIGFLLLTASVFGDAIHATMAESTMKKDPTSREDILVWSHLFCGVMLMMVAVIVGEFVPCMKYFVAHPIAFAATMVNALLGYISIVFYMHLVEQFSAVSAIMVTQTRKFFTVFISFIIFPKPVSVTYILFAVWVLGAIAMNVIVKHRERQVHSSPVVESSSSHLETKLDLDDYKEFALKIEQHNSPNVAQAV